MPAHVHPAGHAACGAAARAWPRVVRGTSLTAAPWKNGGGLTREIAAYPVGASLDTFVWRVSVAEVERSGPFSQFPGVDRTLVLLAGAGMHLSQAHGATLGLTQPLALARFDGAAALDAQLVDGATRDFNLMVRRDRAHASLELWEGARANRRVLDADAALVFCASGALDVRLERGAPATEPGALSASRSQFELSPMDTIVLDAAHGVACEVKGGGVAIVVCVRYV
ncbi:HutD family protein [Trinickia sp. Y13]|uniref:HutD/Ves family protein n=1 Tax=Trinickia sp. Y13 TaxID=2917807 RepID=UPI002405DF37|nr:HutD family protein [Trinickia sp. Y13]MDG0022650.1 HutD family protein [Trinickia sp. Y13]